MATIICCGEELDCPGFTNVCPHCGNSFNWVGQLLGPRENWGSETGETLEEILAIDSLTTDQLLEGDE